MLRTGLLLLGRRQKILINNLSLPGRREEIHHVDRSVYRANRSQKSNQAYDLPNRFFFLDHRRSLSSMHLFDTSSHGGSGRSVNCHGTSLVETSLASIGRQSIPTDDHDIPRLSGQHSQIGSTSSVGMYIYRKTSGLWEFAYSGSISHHISDMLKKRITSFWPVFSKIPSPVKDQWFEEFKATYEWNPDTSFVDVRRLWERKCRLTYSRIISDMKRYDMRYNCMSNEVWRQFVEYWDSEDVKDLAMKISGARKMNRTKRRYGYQVMTQLVNDMKEKIGRTLTYMEAYIQLHYVSKSDVSEDTEWINIYLEHLVAAYDKRVAQVTEFLGRELSYDELNHLFIHFTRARNASSSTEFTHEPDRSNIPKIHRDNTYNIKSSILDDKELLIVVQELNSKVDELEKKISLFRDFMRDMMQERDFMRDMMQERGQGSRST